jgi:iron(III) transport system ATP-binding protein
MAMLEIDGLAKRFSGVPILHDLSLSVCAGRLVTVLGTSGSGKTTLLRLVCGFERAAQGAIRIGSRLVAGPGVHEPPERRRVGYVAQEGALFPHLSVKANVVFGLPGAQRRAGHRVDELLRLLGLSPAYAGRLPHELSGGEQQRVALARALAPQPPLVLLDEPFSALDAALRVETRAAVAEAIAAAGATALLVTHDQAEALSMGAEVAVLRDGKLVQVADPQTLYRRPVDLDLACFVGQAVLLPGSASGSTVSCGLGRLTHAGTVADGDVVVVVRPEQLLVGPIGSACAEARAESVTFYGAYAMVRLRLADGTAIAAQVAGHAAPADGDRVGCRVEGAVMAYPKA